MSEIKVELTQDEAASLYYTFESHLLEIIRDDDEIDNLNWLYNTLTIWKKCRDVVKFNERT